MNTAIVLAAGQGKRMHSDVQKQYLLLNGKPVLCYSLQAFERSPEIEQIVLVVAAGDIAYCRTEIVEKYGFRKVNRIVEGGKERYDSVACGLHAVEKSDYVYIHDGARPFINEEMIARLQSAVEQCGACVAAMPSKDTVKLADAQGNVAETPERRRVWTVQTPQVFSFSLVRDAYEQYLLHKETEATDDAMVVERMSGHAVRLVEGDYRNIKITTQEDMLIAEAFLRQRCGKEKFF